MSLKVSEFWSVLLTLQHQAPICSLVLIFRGDPRRLSAFLTFFLPFPVLTYSECFMKGEIRFTKSKTGSEVRQKQYLLLCSAEVVSLEHIFSCHAQHEMFLWPSFRSRRLAKTVTNPFFDQTFIFLWSRKIKKMIHKYLHFIHMLIHYFLLLTCIWMNLIVTPLKVRLTLHSCLLTGSILLSSLVAWNASKKVFSFFSNERTLWEDICHHETFPEWSCAQSWLASDCGRWHAR